MHIILGPTAVGKTKYAIELAKEVGGEIISADSMQVYRGMDIGTAKPTKEEMQGIPHHLIDIRNPDEEWTVSDFVDQTEKLIKKIKNPIIVGGTGLYLWSLINGYTFPIVPSDPAVRKRLEEEGKNPDFRLHDRLKKVDPQAAEKIHTNDKKRIIRALEVFELTGKPISQVRSSKGEDDHPRLVGKHKITGLKLPREELYKRIEIRVDRMLELGLIDEVKGLLAKGYSRDLRSMQALGYKETIDYLKGKYSYDEYVSYFKQKSRNFARRQMTWFKRFKNVTWKTAP